MTNYRWVPPDPRLLRTVVVALRPSWELGEGRVEEGEKA